MGWTGDEGWADPPDEPTDGAALAARYFAFADAARSPERVQRLRTERGDLSGVWDAVRAACDDPATRDAVLLALLDAARSDDDLAYAGAGPFEDVWSGGDHDVLDRLRAAGADAAALARIREAMWVD